MKSRLIGMLVPLLLMTSGCGGDDDDTGAADAALADGAALVDTGVDSAPDATVTLMFNVAGHDYGSLALGGMTGFPYTVRNVGAVTTGAMTVVITGDDASEFNFGFNGCNGQLLAPQGTCNMAVRFAPAATGSPGPRVASLRASHAGSSEVAQIPITGTALPVPILVLVPSSLGFPDTAVGATSAPQAGMMPPSEGPVTSGLVPISFAPLRTRLTAFLIVSYVYMGVSPTTT